MQKVSGKVFHEIGEVVKSDAYDTKLCFVQSDGTKRLHVTEKSAGGCATELQGTTKITREQREGNG